MPLAKEVKTKAVDDNSAGNFVKEKPALPSESQPLVEILTHSQILEKHSPPLSAVMLGLAEDGLPVLLDVYDPVPGPILVASENQVQNHVLLQSIAAGTELRQGTTNIFPIVLTSDQASWGNVDSGNIYDISTDGPQVLRELNALAHGNGNLEHGVYTLVIDNLDVVMQLPAEAIQDLRWLLLRGPVKGVWPILGLNVPENGSLKNDQMLEFFRTRLLGPLSNRNAISELTNDSKFPSPTPGQFTLREGENWLNFWPIAND